MDRVPDRETATTILESITDGFIAVDHRWRFTYVNREAERIIRRRRGELVGRELWTEFPEAVGTVFEREYRRAMATQETVQFEAYFDPLGSWLDVRAFPADGGLSVYFHDITSRKLAQERLRKSEEEYRLLVDMIPQHIWTTDPDGYHGYFSRRWYEFTGATFESTRGEGWMHLLHPDDRARMMARWQHSLRTGLPYAIEYRFRGADGQYHWFLGQATPLRNEQGEIVRWFGTLTDISERKAHEAERDRLLAQEQQARADAERRRFELEQVTESRGRLIRGFSHDVRNPLSVADGQALLLEDGRRFGALSPEQRESVRRIRRAIRGSLQLIDDLLELARTESGQVGVDRTATDVAQVVREVAEDFRAQAGAAGLGLTVHAPASVQASTDARRLRQILTNLLSNAVKYTSQGEVAVDVRIQDAGGPRAGAWVAVAVSDTGPGIPEDKWDLVFQEFARLAPHAQPGAGIGLAISRRLAQLLDGDLTVRSVVGSGSTFTLWLPMAQPAPAAR